MGTPSGSGLDRAELCPGSLVLPSLDSGEGSIYADHGRAMHRFLDIVAKLVNQGANAIDAGKTAIALLELEHRAVAAAIDLSTVPHTQPGVWQSELAMVFDFELRRGELLPDVKDRQYPKRTSKWQVFGTADLVGVDGDCVVVIDLKTGWGWRRPPEESLQLLFYAVTAAQALGCTRARVGYMVMHENDDVPRFKIAEISELALAAAESRIADVLTKGEGIDPSDVSNFRAGSGCRYCPSIRVCPAHVTRLATMVKGPRHALKAITGHEDLTVIFAEDLPLLLEAIEGGFTALKQLREDVKNAVRAVGSIPLANGYELAESYIERDTLIAEKAVPVLETEFGPGSAERVITIKKFLTKKSLKELVRERAARTAEKMAPVERLVLQRLEEAGAVSTSGYPDVRVQKVKK